MKKCEMVQALLIEDFDPLSQALAPASFRISSFTGEPKNATCPIRCIFLYCTTGGVKI